MSSQESFVKNEEGRQDEVERRMTMTKKMVMKGGGLRGSGAVYYLAS